MLRGFAVGVVLLYHAGLKSIGGGYLGVDVFFVISGFLITNLLARAIESGTFSFADFYARRARRLLPAAYVVFGLVAAVAPWTLAGVELIDLRAQLLGALTFSANVQFWQHTGYFEGAARYKPLLHTWSLAVEEQYYFVIPALLVLLRPNRWRLAMVVLTLCS